MNVSEDLEIELHNWQHPNKDLATEHLKEEMFKQFKMLNPVPKYSIYLHTHKAELDDLARKDLLDKSQTSVRTTEFDKKVYQYVDEFDKKVSEGEGHYYNGRYLKTTKIARSLDDLTGLLHQFEKYIPAAKDEIESAESFADGFSRILNSLGNPRFSKDVLQRILDEKMNTSLLTDLMMGVLSESEYNKRHKSYSIRKRHFVRFLNEFVVVDKSERKYILPT